MFNVFRILVALLIVSTGAFAGFRQINGGAVNRATIVTTASGTTTAIATSNQVYIFEGSANQSFQTPAATGLPLNWFYEIINNSTGTITFKDGATATVGTVTAGRNGKFILSDNSTAAGTWKLNVPAAPGDIITDHGVLSGLSDDDHTQYHNDTRGDARYFTEGEHISASTGAVHAGLPIVLNSSGQVDDSMLPASSSNAWSKIGNSGLTAGTNFLGTTDAIDVVIKSNNTEVIRFKENGLYDTNLGSGVLHSGSTGLIDSRGIVNDVVDASANIAYSKLNLSGNIVNADINASAGIVDTKLATISTTGKVSNSATTATSLNVNDAIAARSATGNITAASFNGAIASGNITGIFGVPNGGTGFGSATANLVLATGATSTSPFVGILPGAVGTVLTSTGVGNLPSYQTVSAGGSTLVLSSVRLQSPNAYGSTNNKIFRFGVTIENSGSDITYTDSSTDGASFTVNDTGLYFVSIGHVPAGGSAGGVSRNSNQLTTDIGAITAAHRVCYSYVTGGEAPDGSCSALLSLTAGDVIRAHGDGAAVGNSANLPRGYFIITKVADL